MENRICLERASININVDCISQKERIMDDYKFDYEQYPDGMSDELYDLEPLVFS